MYNYAGYNEVLDEHIDKLLNETKPIVLFGTMGMGGYAKRALDFLDIKPACFCDNSKIKQAEFFEGLHVLSPDEVKQKYPNASIYICSFNVDNYKHIKIQLENLGFTDVNSFELLYYIYLTKVSKRYLLPNDISNILDVFSNIQDKLIIRRALFSITTICNLRCKQCASLIPYFSNPKHYDKNEIIKSVKKLSESVDAIEELFLFGGEPILHPNLLEVCEEIVKYKNILRFYIISNGKSAPSKELVDIMKRYDINYIVSDYGELSSAIDDIREIANKESVNFTIKDREFMWSDIGAPIKYDFKENENMEKFKKCINNPMACYNVIEGKFHVCSQSAFGTTLGAIPSQQTDYVDLLDDSLTPMQIRIKLDKLLNHKKCITACNYCNIKSAILVKPAIQTTEILEF